LGDGLLWHAAVLLVAVLSVAIGYQVVLLRAALEQEKRERRL
jgi:hypothetical protein